MRKLHFPIRAGLQLVLGWLASCCTLVHAEYDLSEAQIKAAFVYKFTGYVDWPEGSFDAPDSPLTIAVLEGDDVAQSLSGLSVGRLAGKHPLVVKRVQAGDSLTGSQVLFIGHAYSGRYDRVLSAVKGRPLLVVCEADDAFTRGCVINFVTLDQQVRFQVSLPAAAQGNLKISSRLLSVAQQVVTGER